VNVLDRLEGLSSAEEFFDFLGVSYEPQVLHVARLHIMRRMGQYLSNAETLCLANPEDDAQLFALCKAHLEQAYQDFVASSPIAERIFKVHQEAIEPKQAPAKPFVPLTALTVE